MLYKMLQVSSSPIKYYVSPGTYLLYITGAINNAKVKALQHQNDLITVKYCYSVKVSEFQRLIQPAENQCFRRLDSVFNSSIQWVPL